MIISSDAAGNEVQGNLIGTQANGSSALGNAGSGVRIDGAVNNTNWPAQLHSP